MQSREPRYAILIGVLLAATGLYATISEFHGLGVSRWPTADAVFAVDGWSTDPERVELMNGAAYITRTLRGADGTVATLWLVTNQSSKVLSPGAEVPFQGDGYEVAPAPSGVTFHTPDVQGILASRGGQRLLVLYAYGERRGLLGNGPRAWTMALTDGLLGQTNDYYRLYLITPMITQEMPESNATTVLAETLFQRVASWYAADA